MVTHTKGPWVVEQSDLTDTWFIVQKDSHAICNLVGNFHITEEQHAADAALIASAPDLLQACERALALLANPDADQFMADAMEVELQMVINKARGA